MTTTVTQIETATDLEALRLPELQARYAEVLGEETRCPNRRYLIRRITEALEARAAESEAETAGESEVAVQTQDMPAESAPQVTDADAEAGATAGAATDGPAEAEGTPAPEAERPKLTRLSVEQLRERYLEVVGRPTGSTDRRYLIWKIRQAERGLIPVGPRRRREGPPPVYKVLPIRLEADTVARLDEAWRRQGLKSRMELFRRALHDYLAAHGEDGVAALFAPEGV
ncbi:MAG: ribbon-helix-helix protein, CopG family [Acidobacteria bacterium]|nr:MAG: ribbon-helix-helix protein, CopG family [Acidobacteriota bacterium]